VNILAIDPGTTESAYVIFNPEENKILGLGLLDNVLFTHKLMGLRKQRDLVMVLERIKSYGGMVGDSIFTTCAWSGIFVNTFGVDRVWLMGRREVLSRLDITGGSTDRQVRERVIAVLGNIKGMKKDVWQAAGLALAFASNSGKFMGWDYLYDRAEGTGSELDFGYVLKPKEKHVKVRSWEGKI